MSDCDSFIENDIGEKTNIRDDVLTKGRGGHPDEWTERNLLLQEEDEKVGGIIKKEFISFEGHSDSRSIDQTDSRA